jgi:hypothetical protein
MTTTEPAGRGRRHRAAMWLGHHAARIDMATFATMAVAFTIVTLIEPGRAAWILTVLVAATMAFSIVASECDRRVHRRNLCVLDVDRAPLLDPEGQITHHARTLRAFHSPMRRMSALAGSMVLMLVGVFVGAWARDNDVPLAAVIAIVPFGIMVVLQIWNVRVSEVHGRLQPWCPLCAGGGDDGDEGDDDPEPEPTPPPAKKDKITA